MYLCLSVHVCLTVSACACPSVCLSLSVSLCVHVRLSVHVCLSVCVHLCMSICLCLPVHVRLSVRVRLSVCLCAFVCLCLCMSFRLSICVSVYVATCSQSSCLTASLLRLLHGGWLCCKQTMPCHEPGRSRSAEQLTSHEPTETSGQATNCRFWKNIRRLTPCKTLMKFIFDMEKDQCSFPNESAVIGSFKYPSSACNL